MVIRFDGRAPMLTTDRSERWCALPRPPQFFR